MNEPSDERSVPSGAVAALSTVSPVTEDVAIDATGRKPQPLSAPWDSAPDAAASTCVSGSEGSIPSTNQQQHGQSQQQKLQRDIQSPENSTETFPERLPASGSNDNTVAPTIEQQQQQQQLQTVQQQSGLALHVATIKRPQNNKSDGTDECGMMGLSGPLTSDTTSSVAVQHLQRGSSGSSCCSSTSIGGELRGLINALASVDTAAGSGELQQLLQQLLAERDLYKAAFGAAKEELKDLECRQQQLTQALQQSEHERRQERMQQQLAAAAAEGQGEESGGPQDPPLQWNGSSSSSSSAPQQPADSSGNPASSTCSSGDGPYNWLHQLHACIASGTYPRPELLQKSVEQQQQLIRLAEGLQQERESYVEAVACLHSQLREAREDVSLYMSAHATHAADLTAESDEAIRASDLWLQNALSLGTKYKFWGMGSVLHSQEAAAASAAAAARAPTISRACSSEAQSEAVSAAAAAALSAAPETIPGVSVTLAAAASVFCVQEDSVGDEDGAAAAVAVGSGGAAAATAELERLWWGHAGDAFVERQQLLKHSQQRERNKRLLWFLE